MVANGLGRPQYVLDSETMKAFEQVRTPLRNIA
jgi:hypothetical protein